MTPPSVSLAPTVLGERSTPDRLELDLRVPADLACLPGHFPGTPIVPGVVQVHWVMDAIGRWTDLPVAIRGIEALKFKKPLRPGNEVTLVIESVGDGDGHVDRDPEGRRYRFELRTESEAVSVGRILLVDPRVEVGNGKDSDADSDGPS